MKCNLFLRVIIFYSFFFCSSFANAKTIPEQKAISWATDKADILVSVLSSNNPKTKEEKTKVLDDLFLNYVDYDYISKFLVGRYWREMNKEQKLRYNNIFKEYSMNFYRNIPLDMGFDVDYKIMNVIYDKNYTIVRALINVQLQKGTPNSIALEFRLKKMLV